MSIYTTTKTGLFQVGDVTVGGPTGAGLSGGEVILIFIASYIAITRYKMLCWYIFSEKEIIHSNATASHAQHTFP